MNARCVFPWMPQFYPASPEAPPTAQESARRRPQTEPGLTIRGGGNGGWQNRESEEPMTGRQSAGIPPNRPPGQGYLTSEIFQSGGSATAWWRVRDSNPRPPRCERGALPTELTPLSPHVQPVSLTARPGRGRGMTIVNPGGAVQAILGLFVSEFSIGLTFLV